MSNLNSDNIKPRRDPFILQAFRWLFPKVNAISPRWAGILATKLFFKIFRYPFSVPEKEFLKSAEWKNFSYGKIRITYYHWINTEKPMLFFVHGWQGRAAQFRIIIEQMKEHFEIIGIDLPAHGKSEGKRTNIINTAEFLAEFQKRIGRPYAIVGHSFGGIATIFSRRMFDLKFDKLITIGSPVIGQRIYEDFLRLVNAPIELSKYINNYVLKHFQVDFGKITSADLINDMEQFPMLAIHDTEDQDTVIEHLEFLREKCPHVETMVTKGLGHNRILRNSEVIERIEEFLEVN